MGLSRPRYNKAREAQLRAQRAGKTSKSDDHGADGNAETIIPKSAAEKAKERELRLLQEQNASSGHMSSRKRKRMENYVDKKLKQERRGELFKSLAVSQESVGPLQLQSSSTLGSKQFRTNRDKLDRISTLQDRKRLRAVDALHSSRKLYHSDESDDDDPVAGSDAEQLETYTGNGVASTSGGHPLQTGVVTDATETTSAPSPAQPLAARKFIEVGSGLRKDVDGKVSVPVITVRKREPRGRRRLGKQRMQEASTSSDSDEGATSSSFDSSDSAYDSEEAEGDLSEAASEIAVERTRSTSTSSASSFVDDGQEWHGFGHSDQVGDDDPDSLQQADTVTAEEHLPVAGGSSFKDWASSQIGLGVKSEARSNLADLEHVNQPRRAPHTGPVYGPLGEQTVMPSGSLMAGPGAAGASSSPRKAVTVDRSAELQEGRMKLPILAEEDRIMEAIRHHTVTVICGETGSGKTTQVPQFLYEAGFGTPGSDNPGMIGVTQPRRVAAMSMASRVATELSLPPSRVSYQIRYDATVSSSTSIKFMTDGVLLRELAADFLLKRYSVVIVDEAHERSVNTDVLIGTLSRVVRLRESMWRKGEDGMKPLRLIIMSATLRVTDFTENKRLFDKPPPVISVDARQYPVALHFNRKTKADYIKEAYNKAAKIHARLPPGGILIFLTGQNEIQVLCKRLEKRFGVKAIAEREQTRSKRANGLQKRDDKTQDVQTDDIAPMRLSGRQAAPETEDLELGNANSKVLTDNVGDGEATEDPDALDSDYEDDEDIGEMFVDREEDSDVPMHILPLYSLLPSQRQMQVFEPPPEGHRLVIVATNVAETSITIPGIKYVVDAGLAKERNYNPLNGIQCFDVTHISKASAAQRAGRAGRTGPGHCYRLYSSAVFERSSPDFMPPEIMRTPIEGIVLQMKSMNIDSVVNFPFPTPPDRAALQQAERTLISLGALSGSLEQSVTNALAHITELGNVMSLFPLSPRYSKMLVTGQQHGCLPYVIAIVSALSVGDLFLREDALGFSTLQDGDDEQSDATANDEFSYLHNANEKAKELLKGKRKLYFDKQSQHSALGKRSSDVFKILSVVGAYAYAEGSMEFCSENFVLPKAMQEIQQLRGQISRIVEANFPGLNVGWTAKLPPPSSEQLKILRQLLTSAFIDRVAIRSDIADPSTGDYSKYASTRGIPYRAVGVDEDVYIHPSSVLFHGAPPQSVVFADLVKTSRTYMKMVTKINQAWIPTLGKSMCTFTRLSDVTPGGTAGVAASLKITADKRECFVRPKFANFENLVFSPIKATQKRVGTRWVFA